ncbi:MAG: hypothetical protein U0Z44_05840 [Kouleothrix sp.]
MWCYSHNGAAPAPAAPGGLAVPRGAAGRVRAAAHLCRYSCDRAGGRLLAGNALPPAPATITPAGQPTAYPRCTPAPGETQLPWPTRLPARAQFPTMLPVNQPGSTVMQTIMQLPDAILSVDVAVHPLSGDPAVAAIAAPLTSTGGPHAFVRSYDGRTRTWGALQNLDIGAAAIGQHRFRSIALAVSGDGTITAVWGATAHPVYGLWASISRDGGASWAAPEHLADNVFGVLDVAATLDGQVAVLALQREPVAPIVITRWRRHLEHARPHPRAVGLVWQLGQPGAGGRGRGGAAGRAYHRLWPGARRGLPGGARAGAAS